MTMAIDNQQRHFNTMGYENMAYSGAPQFTNPWVSNTSGTSSSQLYPTVLGAVGLDGMSKPQQARTTSVSMPYTSIPVTAPSLGTGSDLLSSGIYGTDSSLDVGQDLVNPIRSDYNTHTYTSEPTSYAPASVTSAPYSGLDYSQNRSGVYAHQPDRRLSQPSVPSNTFLSSQAELAPRHRQSSLVDFNNRNLHTTIPRNDTFNDLEASRGMLAMSQTTPRNIYEVRARQGSGDSYGFPATHSSSSSISSASTYPYFGSVDSSVSDYSSAASDTLESMPTNPRTLPRPSGLVGAAAGNMPPAPQSMMGQFSSKVSSNTQKKHKCKICDKRFTRPSSLQTHTYSHTGEKPFACDVEGCTRQFSVVSNLRRHRKVHGKDRTSSHDSQEE